MVLNYLCDDLLRPAAYRFSYLVQGWCKASEKTSLLAFPSRSPRSQSIFPMLCKGSKINRDYQIFLQLFSLKIARYIVPDTNILARLGKRIPGDVKPPVSCQQLVGIRALFEIFHQLPELSRIRRTDVGSLTDQVLRIAHTANLSVNSFTTESRVDDDGPHQEPCRLQQEVATISQVCHNLHRGAILWVLAQVKKLTQLKVRREANAIKFVHVMVCFHGNAY